MHIHKKTRQQPCKTLNSKTKMSSVINMSELLIKLSTSNHNNSFRMQGKVKSTSKLFASSLLITKNMEKVQCTKEDQKKKMQNNDRIVASVLEMNQKFTINIHKSTLVSYADDFWLVINNSSISSYQISAGDILKIGKKCYRINKIKGIMQSQQLLQDKLEATQIRYGGLGKVPRSPLEINGITREAEHYCRICFEAEEENDNYFICPCLCSGSMGYIHTKCFFQWILSKITIEIYENCQIVTFDPLCCESCKHLIPDMVKIGNKSRHIFSELKPDGRYMMLELSRMASHIQRKLLIISLENTESFQISSTGKVLFGNDMRGSGFFKIVDNQIHLMNNTGDFKTMVLAKKSIMLDQQQNLSFNIGTSLVEFSFKQKFTFSRCFCIGSKTNK